MNTYVFNLDDYFEYTQKYYYFFDGLIAFEKKLKKDVLKEVDIYDVSYRSDRLKLKVKNNNRNILLKYFNYNDIDISSKMKYEKCISKIYYCVYYLKLDSLTELLNELDLFINENNYLKPLFTLFKVFGTMPLNYSHFEIRDMIAKDLDYLKVFGKTNYFTEELAYLYSIVMRFFNMERDMSKLDEYSNLYRELRWFDYTVRANYYYLVGKDADSLMYYSAALEECKKTYNMERVLRTVNNISLMYNLLGKYQFSLDITENIVKYAFTQEATSLIKSITMHYLYSNIMLKRYDEVFKFYNIVVLDEKFLNETSIIAVIISAYRLNKMDQIKKFIDKNKDIKNVSIFLSAIESIIKTKSASFAGLDGRQYLVDFAKTLKD